MLKSICALVTVGLRRRLVGRWLSMDDEYTNESDLFSLFSNFQVLNSKYDSFSPSGLSVHESFRKTTTVENI